MAQTVDKQNPIPRHLQVRAILESSIREGKYAPGARLRGERDLARKLEVSQMTVNRAIQSLVQDGWLRREIGRGTFVREDFSLPVATSVTIGFAIPLSISFAEEDFYLGSLLRGIQRAIVNAPAGLKVIEAPKGSLYQRVIDSELDGCILVDVLDQSRDDVLRLAEEGHKMVILSADQEPLHVPYVDSDNVGGTRQAVEHLLSLGHRRIAGAFAYLGMCNSRQRLESFVDTTAQHGVDLEEGFVLDLGNGEPIEGDLRERILAMFASPDRPTAVLCGGFFVALEMMRLIREAGLQIPEDVSVVGYDDPLAARYLSPALTTVRQPLEEMGQRAMEFMSDWLLKGQKPPIRSVLPETFLVRNSTSPVSRDEEISGLE